MGDFNKARVASVKVYNLLSIENKVKNIQNPVKCPETLDSIEFVNVWFKYPTRNEFVYQNMSFKIDQGQKVAFAGYSGCGKSTGIQLIQRFYDVDRGEILVNGENIKNYDIKA